jgi:hypothetical protein
MPWPSKDEFIELLRTRTPLDIVNEYLLTGTPFAFEAEPQNYDLFRSVLANALRVQQNDVTVVGSGRIGFSLDPSRYGNPYSPTTSDIDTVIVNAELFDIAWHQLCSRGRSQLGLNWKARRALEDHRKGNVFYGYIEPDRLTGAVTISPTWFRTFRGLARRPELAQLEVQGRLYRTWDHVRYHQIYSLAGIKTRFSIQ